MNQSITIVSDPDDSDDDVTFPFSHIRINAEDDSKSIQLTPEHSLAQLREESPEYNDEIDDSVHQTEASDVISANADSKSLKSDDVDQSDDDVTSGFSQKQNKSKIPENDGVTQVDDDEKDDHEDEEGEFTFMCLNNNNNDDDVTKLYDNDEIRTVFPLFDQSLLYNADNDNGKRINVPVNNVFIESPRRSSHSGESSGTGTSTFTAISSSDSSEINIKSNSTGFSKLWRFRDNDNMNRSHSGGRDTFVFLNQTTTPSLTPWGKDKGVSDGVKGKSKDVNKMVKESAHEVYLKKKGGKSEEDKRKSYLPYRPGLMGFFTNVNGGLSKNVHPF